MRFASPIHAGSVLIVACAAITASCAHHANRASSPPPPARAGKTEIGVASWYGAPYHGRQTASGEIYDMFGLTAAHRNLPFQTWVEVENLANGKRVDVRINDRGPFVHRRIIDLSQTAAQEIDMLGPGTAKVRLTVVKRPANISTTNALAAARTPGTLSPPAATVTPTTPAMIETSRAATRLAAKPAPVAIESAEMASAAGASATGTTNEAPLPAGPISSSSPLPAPMSGPVAPMPRFVVQAGAFADRVRAETLRMTMADAFAEARTLVDATRTPPLWRVLVGREMTRDQALELAGRVRKQTGAAIVVPEVAAPDAVPSIPETESASH